MKQSSPSITNVCDEGSTLDVQQDLQPQPQGQPQSQPQHHHPLLSFSASPTQKSSISPQGKHQAWYPSNSLTRNEAFIEAQVLQLTEECRLFQDDEEHPEREEDNLALFQRNEIQTSWALLGNGAFSEVYTIQEINLLDSGFVDPQQQEARRAVQSAVAAGRPQTRLLSLAPAQESSKPQYVIKHLRRDLLTNRKKFVHAAGDLVLEAMYLSKLKHPNIIALRGCAVGGPGAYSDGRHDGFFLILDRLDMTLSEQIQQWERAHKEQPHSGGKVCAVYSRNLSDFEERLDIAHQVGLALEYLHSRDIIFRDLKPDNIGLIQRGGKPLVQLFDFGLCRELPEASPPEQSVFHMSGVGTRRYMAPEVFMGSYYNVKADVYSWTMVFHAMLSLQRPFEMYNAQLHKLLVCQEGVRPTIYNDWPLPIQHLLRSGWCAQSKDRPQMEQICRTLQGLLEEIVTNKTSPSATMNAICPEVSNPEHIDCEQQASPSINVVEETFVRFIDTWTATLCTGSGNRTTKDNGIAGKRSKRSLLHTLEAHLVADAAGGQVLMLRRDRNGTADYPQLMHLRSSYL